MTDHEIERYIDRVIHDAKKEMRENLLTDIAEAIVKASHKVNKQTDPKDMYEALRYEVENKLRMGV
ncbi:MAG TPA: hypothetical protein VF692_12725 [Pyrinomonadaceae bacterium]|jgi:hypothetical protein